MSTAQYLNVSYGLSQALLNVFPSPIVAQRAPGANDKAQIGTLWIDQPANSAYVLTSIANNASNWEAISGGAGNFTAINVTTGPNTIVGTTRLNVTGGDNTLIGSATNASGNTQILGNIVDLDAFGDISLGGLFATSIDIGGGSTAPINIGNDNGITLFGNTTIEGGNLSLTTSPTAYIALPGPVKLMSGAGAPAGGLATEIGDMYINTTAASATTRLYVATAVGTWTNVTCAA